MIEKLKYWRKKELQLMRFGTLTIPIIHLEFTINERSIVINRRPTPLVVIHYHITLVNT